MHCIGSPGICDHCACKPDRGTYVAVLNEWLCDSCYKEWQGYAKYYPEDVPVERKRYIRMKAVLGCIQKNRDEQ